MGRITPADGRPNSSAGASPAAHEPPGRLNPAGFGAADCASLAQPALHHKRMVVCPIPDHERKTDKGRELPGANYRPAGDALAALDSALAAFAGVLEERD